MLQHTAHSAFRSALRGLSDEDIEYVYNFGKRYHRDGAWIYFLRRRDIPPHDQRISWVAGLIGTALIVSTRDNRLITTWRNRRSGLKIIREKPIYRVGFRRYPWETERETL